MTHTDITKTVLQKRYLPELRVLLTKHNVVIHQKPRKTVNILFDNSRVLCLKLCLLCLKTYRVKRHKGPRTFQTVSSHLQFGQGMNQKNYNNNNKIVISLAQLSQKIFNFLIKKKKKFKLSQLTILNQKFSRWSMR